MNPVITVKDLSIGFNGRTVLSGATFDVAAGEIFTILGGSGCGKTTLMPNIIGLETPISGSIIINGIDVLTANTATTQHLKEHIGVMFQSGALMSSMTLLENVMLPLEEHTDLPRTIMEETARLKLTLVGLGQSIHYYPAEISGGMVKRAAIARAMALDPGIIFLDEPSAGLDPMTRTELDSLIYQLARNLNITFVIVTHELDTIRSIADNAIILNGGKIIAKGTVPYLENDVNIPFVKRFFHPKEST